MLWITRTTYPLVPNWDANPKWTFVGDSLSQRSKSGDFQRFIELDHMMKRLSVADFYGHKLLVYTDRRSSWMTSMWHLEYDEGFKPYVLNLVTSLALTICNEDTADVQCFHKFLLWEILRKRHKFFVRQIVYEYPSRPRVSFKRYDSVIACTEVALSWSNAAKERTNAPLWNGWLTL